MAKKYLDYDGLLYFWQKIKTIFISDVIYDSSSKKIQKTKNGTASDVVTLSTVATSGSYNDLSSKPTIPSAGTGTSYPAMDGTRSLGSNAGFARVDHVHPTDTSRAPLASPAFTGTPTAPTASAGTSTTQIATTEFVANSVGSIVSGVSDVEVDETSVVTGGVANLINLDFGQGYGTCDTAQTDSAKTVALDGFKAVDGAIVAVRFSNAVDKIYTLNVNSTGAYKVSKRGLTPSGPTAADSFPELAAARSLAVFVLKKTTSGTMYHYMGAAYGTASTSKDGLMTIADKTKLDGIESGAEVNQNAFSNVKVGSTTVEADTKTDTLELVAGSNVTLTPDATNDKVTIAATDTTYTTGTASELDTGTGTNTRVWTPKVLADYVTGKIATAITGAASFQGTAPTTFAPTGYKKGYYWIVGTAGTYAGQVCEPGDMIFAVEDYSNAYSASDFSVIQTNLDITSITNVEIDTILAA